LPFDEMGRRLRRVVIGTAVVLSVGFLIMYADRTRADRLLAREAEATAVPLVDVAVVNGKVIEGSLTLPGGTAAWYESTIYARVSGYVAHWSVDIGDHVSAGQLMASIDTPELDAELSAAKAKLRVALAQVKVKAADAQFARSTHARWRDSPRGVVSEQERESKKALDASAVAQLEAAQAEVSLDRADVERLSALQQFKRVVAPYAGTVTQRRIDIGDLVAADSPANTTPLYRMVQDDPMRVFVDVPQSVANELMQAGVPAQVIPSDSSADTIAGTITRTSNAIDPKARTFRAELDIPNSQHRLVTGQYVQVAFALQNRDFRQVPAAALVFRTGDPEVAQVASDGSVHFHPVTIARDDGDTVELSAGVSKGDRLVLNINSAITEGQKVRVNGADRAQDATVAMHVP
jgi:membrane fusion protein, multidrug efflux system